MSDILLSRVVGQSGRLRTAPQFPKFTPPSPQRQQITNQKYFLIKPTTVSEALLQSHELQIVFSNQPSTLLLKNAMLGPSALSADFYCPTRTESILMGVVGLSLRVGTSEICFTKSMPSTTLPKTGCALSVDLSNQSKKELLATLMKNWDPPDSGWPVKYERQEHWLVCT